MHIIGAITKQTDLTGVISRQAITNSCRTPISTAFLNKAFTRFESGRLNEAALMIDRAVEIDPKNSEALLLLAACYDKNGQQKEASAVLSYAVSVEPGNLKMKIIFGAYAYSLHKYGMARAALLDIEKAAPSSKGLHFAIGICNFNLRYFYEAAHAFEKEAVIDPSNRSAEFNATLSYLMAEKSLRQ